MQRRAIIGLAVIMVVGVALWGIVNNTQAYSVDESQVDTVNGFSGLVEKNQSTAALSAKADFLPSPPRASLTIGGAGGPQTLSVLSMPTSLYGSISAMGVDGLVINTPQGQVRITGGEWMYLLRQGFSANLGDTIHMEGTYEKGTFLVSLVEDAEGGSSVLLRDAAGQLVRGVGR